MQLKNIRRGYPIVVFILLFVLVLYKICLFHRLCYGTIVGYNLQAVYLPKIAVSLFLASFCLLSRSQWWTLPVLLLTDIWCVANLTYFRANNLFLSLDAIRMASNLSGYESAIGQYVDFTTWLFPLSTLVFCGVLLALYVFLGKPEKRLHVAWFVTAFALSAACSVGGAIRLYQVYHQGKPVSDITADYFNPFVIPADLRLEEWQNERQQFNYVYDHSILTYSVNMLYDGYLLAKQRNADVQFTDAELQLISNALGADTVSAVRPKHNLIFVMVESFESWTMELTDVHGQYITDNINRLLDRHKHLYCKKMCSQVKHGVSGDGHMIANTGLLPLQSGAACMLYGYNTYPNFAHMFEHSFLLNPTRDAWNKSRSTINYGYKGQLCPEDMRQEGSRISASNWWDENIFPIAIERIGSYDSDTPFCAFVLTISSHSPFNMYNHRYDVDLREDWSVNARCYLGSIHYMDHYLGQLIDYMEATSMFDNTLLVITGDHTIYKPATISEYLLEGATQAGLSVADGNNYVPFIMVGAGIKENIEIEREVYQMDIYPTILSAIGAESYFWHGFGVDLLSADTARLFSEKEAYLLSDKLIRSNYFHQ